MKPNILLVALLLVAGAANLCAQSLSNPETETKITRLISRMTLDEKITMLHGNSSFTSGGVKRLGIPEIVTSDGPHGVRPEHGRDWVLDEGVEDAGTYLPTGNTLAATWNPSLGYRYGAVLGSEASYRGKDIILGPGINVLRSPLNGRNFEYLSEDPFLISKMVVGYIKGVQDQGISACVKHYAANNEEVDRGTVDVRMSERALREIYLPGFKAAVEEGQVNAVMGAYNKFRGQFATHSPYLINDILKGEWGFKGLVMSDWGSVHDTRDALRYGTDLEMGTDLVLQNNTVSQTAGNTGKEKVDLYSQFFMADAAKKMVLNKEIEESVIDDKVRRILRVMFKTHMIEGSRAKGSYNAKSHQQIALQVAEEGIVLLKNQSGLLPLSVSNIKSIAVIGENASRENAMGGGSSQVKAKYEITPIQGLKNYADKGTQITYARGYQIVKDQQADQALIAEAVAAARKAEVAIIFCGWTHGYDYSKWDNNAYDAEGVDKPNMTMPFGQDELIKAVLNANPKTIVVLMGGGAVDMSSWIDQAPAVIQGWYPGMEGGNALTKIIYGQVNPSGKLPVTFPKKLEDSPAHKLGQFPGVDGVVNYNEDIFVGYRYYDTYKIQPQFAFGHGLSFTTFVFSDMDVQVVGDGMVVKVKLKNSGKVAGAEVLQLYVKQHQSKIRRPEKELKAFKKVFLQPGEAQVIELKLDAEAFKYYDEEQKNWLIAPGSFTIMAGSSSADIRAEKTRSL